MRVGAAMPALLLQVMGQGIVLLMPVVVVYNNDWTKC